MASSCTSARCSSSSATAAATRRAPRPACALHAAPPALPARGRHAVVAQPQRGALRLAAALVVPARAACADSRRALAWSCPQVVNLHYMLSKATVKARPSVLWCYKKDLYLSSHRKKRVNQVKKLVARGLLDPEKEDPFSLFVASTSIRYCYYSETHTVLGQTFGMCVLQVWRLRALIPRALRAAAARRRPLTPPAPDGRAGLRGAHAQPAGADDGDGGRRRHHRASRVQPGLA